MSDEIKELKEELKELTKPKTPFVDKKVIIVGIVMFGLTFVLNQVGSLVNNIITNPQQTKEKFIAVDNQLNRIEEKINNIKNDTGSTDANIDYLKTLTTELKTKVDILMKGK